MRRFHWLALATGPDGKTTEESTMRTYLIVLAMTCAAFFGAVEYTKPVTDQPMVIIGYQDE